MITSRRPWSLVVFGVLVLFQARAGAQAPPARELAQEILSDPRYQTELAKQPKPRDRPADSGCGSDGGHRMRSAPSASTGAAGSVVSLLAWLAVGVAAALVAVWVGGALVRRRRDAEADASELVTVDTDVAGLDPSLAAVQGLAAQGHYTQAVHELLLLTVRRLADRHGRTVSGWLTSRELIRLLPATEDERNRFARLVAWVERSLFGGRPVDQDTFDACLADFQSMGLSG